MAAYSFRHPIGDSYELETFEIFGEEHTVAICEAIDSLYELNLSAEVSQTLIDFEQKLNAESENSLYYEAYFRDYYSEWAEDYENRQG